MTRARFALLAGLALLAAAAPAAAWEPIDPAQPVWRRPVGFHLNERGSDDLDIMTVESTVVRAFEDWSGPECTDLVVEYLGLTDRTALEYTQVVSWTEEGWDLGQETIGATLSSFDQGPGATIDWSTMQLNGQDWRWIAGVPASSPFDVDLYSIVVHEAGHYMGLGHSNDPDSAMTAAYTGAPLALTDDDVRGVCTLYPEGSIPPPQSTGDDPETEPQTPIDDAPPATNPPPDVPAPCTEPGCDPTMIYCRDAADCQAHRVCVDAQCRDAEEVVGSGCSFDDECESGLCIDVDGDGMCTARCVADLDCPEQFVCEGRPGFTTCQREVLMVEPDEPVLAEPVLDEPLPAADPVEPAGDESAVEQIEPAPSGDGTRSGDDGGCSAGIAPTADAPAWPALALLLLGLRRRRSARG